jgi:succinate dehydrogenase hydrophobic anchor subunit
MLRIASAQSTRVAITVTPRIHIATGGRISRQLSSKVGPLEADSGGLATHTHHAMTTFLAVATPIYFAVPDRWVDGNMNKAFGILMAINISAHSWIGLNYVATDYVPKLSKALLGPARIVNAGIGAITLLGLCRIALADGSIKGAIKGLWNPPKKEQK